MRSLIEQKKRTYPQEAKWSKQRDATQQEVKSSSFLRLRLQSVDAKWKERRKIDKVDRKMIGEEARIDFSCLPFEFGKFSAIDVKTRRKPVSLSSLFHFIFLLSYPSSCLSERSENLSMNVLSLTWFRSRSTIWEGWTWEIRESGILCSIGCNHDYLRWNLTREKLNFSLLTLHPQKRPHSFQFGLTVNCSYCNWRRTQLVCVFDAIVRELICSSFPSPFSHSNQKHFRFRIKVCLTLKRWLNLLHAGILNFGHCSPKERKVK